MHQSSLKRMEWFTKNFLKEDRNYKVLDIGSYDVNGSYRDLFSDKRFEYVGLDMESGPNVDIVPDKAYAWHEIENDKYDIVISGQALEHIEFFWITVSEIARVTKKNGLICIIAPNGFEEHRYPVDCWRFFTDGMIALARYYKLEILHAHTNCAPSFDQSDWFSERNADSMLIARKSYEGEAQKINLEEYKCIPTKMGSTINEMKTFEEYKQYQKVLAKETAETREEKKLTRSKLTLIRLGIYKKIKAIKMKLWS